MEIVEEAVENGRKVVVFSYFRDVLDLVLPHARRTRRSGPITGDVPPAGRQQIVDDVHAAPSGHAVLRRPDRGGRRRPQHPGRLAWSILCEPQWKPSTRGAGDRPLPPDGSGPHRSQVHRLLAEDSVDERIREILETKRQLFDDFARRSDTAETMPEAVDSARRWPAR